MKSSHLWIAIHFLFVVDGAVSNNSPPVLRSTKDWYVTEDEEVGSVVTRLQASDQEKDHITFTLEPQNKGDTIQEYLLIDSEDRVRIAKPLTGLAGAGTLSYMLRVRLDDGTTDIVTEVRLEVSKAGQGGAKLQPGLRGFGINGNFGRPLNFGAFGDYSGPYPSIPTPADSTRLPVLTVNTTWVVDGDAAVGSVVDTLRVIDLTGEGYIIGLEGGQGLVQVNSGLGLVTVAASLAHQIGDHFLNVTATSPHGTVLEPVVLKVLPPSSPPPTQVPLPVPESPRAGINKQQDLRVVGGSGNVPGSIGSAKPSTELPIEVPKPDVSLTVIPIVVVAGISPLLVILYCCWRRHCKKSQAKSKESAVIYSDKGEEAAATEITPGEPREQPDRSGRRGSSILGLAALWQRRAQSNKYEEGSVRGGRGNRKVSEMSTSATDVWEFPRHHLKILGILGEGCFGQVWRCEATGLKGNGSMLVAVKTLKESAGDRERQDLIQELKVLKNLGYHPNVVSLLGCCSEKDPIFVILEYMVGGKLQSYLRASRADTAYNNLHGSSSSLTPRDLTLFTYQIARGMEFLARNGIIHRDLAARNVLVGEEKICKVADFGFARDVANNRVYERKSDGRLPIRWMAPESLFDNIFTTKSDVWSFGVLLWEIVTLGSTPYPGLGAVEVMRKVKEGYRLEKPDHCRREVYNIMYYCWDKDPKERPSFTELVHTLEGLLMSEVEYIELDRFPEHTYYNVVSEKSDELL
nr:tyrosine kinase receptor Cad96Ca-like [Cherax quadricarinatus]